MSSPEPSTDSPEPPTIVRQRMSAVSRRYPLVVALLVGLAAVPMLAAVVAGSVSLHTTTRPRTPFVADPPRRPVVIPDAAAARPPLLVPDPLGRPPVPTGPPAGGSEGGGRPGGGRADGGRPGGGRADVGRPGGGFSGSVAGGSGPVTGFGWAPRPEGTVSGDGPQGDGPQGDGWPGAGRPGGGGPGRGGPGGGGPGRGGPGGGGPGGGGPRAGDGRRDRGDQWAEADQRHHGERRDRGDGGRGGDHRQGRGPDHRRGCDHGDDVAAWRQAGGWARSGRLVRAQHGRRRAPGPAGT
ncbi:MAG: hypothetical protein QOI74_3427 [Micromonosporaceae bacterium]|nr:hypothetical protein [Micromonosporaceae bacterium]